MRYASKEEFVERIERTHQAFTDLLNSVPESRRREKGVWGDGWTVCDLLAHLTEWEQMALSWHREGRDGGRPAIPAQGYKYNQIPELNRAIWRKHKEEPQSEVVSRFDTSYKEILSLIKELSPEELLDPGYFPWTKEYPLTTYLGPNTCSHYTFALKVLKRWLRAQNAAAPTAPTSGRRTKPRQSGS